MDSEIRLSRRELMAVGAVGACALSLPGVADDKIPTDETLEIIDCHTHFYDPLRPEGVPWPDPNSPLYRTVLPEHLKALKKFRPLSGTVIVEASAWPEDNAWLLELAKTDPFIVGIVGNLTPGDDKFNGYLQRFAADRLFRGIRINVKLLQGLLDKYDLTDLRKLADRNLSLDVNGGPEMPAVVAVAAKRLPELRFVQNHVGNVPVTSSPPPAEWQAGIRAAAAQPNVFCKISALLESAWHHGGKSTPNDLDFYRPYIDTVWQAFGDDRVIYGSNWPVSERASDYETLQRIYLEYASEKGRQVLQQFCSLNAKRAYKWLSPAERI